MCCLVLSYYSLQLALSLFLVCMLFAYSHKRQESFHYCVLVIDVSIFCYYHCALLAKVFAFLEVSEVYSHFICGFLIAGVLLSSHNPKADVREARMIGFTCGYALMAYGIKANKWAFLLGVLLYLTALLQICSYCKRTPLTFSCYVAWHIGALIVGGVYFGIFSKYLAYISLEILREIAVSTVSAALGDAYYLNHFAFIFPTARWVEQGNLKLNSLAQCAVVNLTLMLVRRNRNTIMPQILEYALRSNNRRVISHLSTRNFHFLLDGLISHPNFSLLVLLYRCKYDLLRGDGRHRAFLHRLRRMQVPADSTCAREAALMLELLEKAQAKLLVLWLSSKRHVSIVRRLPNFLWLDLVEYL